MQKKWLRVAIFDLFIAAILGVLMRYAFVEELRWMTFGNVMHAHSHIAMLGWIYLGLYIFLTHLFLPKEKSQLPFYRNLFWLTQLSVVGMLIAFPIQGYAGWSIAFSALHILLSYVFIFRFLMDLGRQSEKVIYSRLFAITALFFMVLSTLAIWAMIPIMLLDMRGSALYYAAVQFYLHFQFNGWFIFALLALFFRILEDGRIVLPRRTTTFYLFLSISCLLTYVLAVTWSKPLPILFYINSFGVLLQLAALIFFLLIIKKLWQPIKALSSRRVNFLFGVAFISFIIKIIIQTAVVIPYIATIAYTIRNFVIGFLHLLLLGLVTAFLLGLGTKFRFISEKSKLVQIGVVTFLSGLVLTEFILFLQGMLFWGAMGFLPYYYELLFYCSLLLPAGVLLLLLSERSNFRSTV